MSIGLCVCVALSRTENEDFDIKFGSNIRSYSTQVVIANGTNWSEYKTAVRCKLKATPSFLTKICVFSSLLPYYKR